MNTKVHNGFYMLAGTVQSEQNIQQIQSLLASQKIYSDIQDDELKIDGRATIYFRAGFAHEFILVGDAPDREDLMSDVEQLSSVLCNENIQHAYEVYDTENIQIHDYSFHP